MKVKKHYTGVSYWAVTGTFHGAVVCASTEGEARRLFHKAYKGESITHIRPSNFI